MPLGPRHEGEKGSTLGTRGSCRAIGKEKSPDYLDTKDTALINRRLTTAYTRIQLIPLDAGAR